MHAPYYPAHAPCYPACTLLPVLHPNTRHASCYPTCILLPEYLNYKKFFKKIHTFLYAKIVEESEKNVRNFKKNFESLKIGNFQKFFQKTA
jgi:hypothetical protein